MAATEGVVFPVGKNGKRSTTWPGQQIFAEAVRPIDAALADAILKERKWRANYIGYVEKLTVRELESAENAITIAQSGLNAAYQVMQFERNGQTASIVDAMTQPQKQLHTVTIKGSGAPAPFTVPRKEGDLSGQALIAQLEAWAQRDHIEPDHKTAIEAVIAHPEWLTADRAYVLLGAGSEMGPFESLLAWGATVVAIDLDRPKIWQRLIKIARESAGTMIFPVAAEAANSADDDTLAQHAGANLISHAPEIAAWLNTLDQPLNIGCYAYLDGGGHVQVALAMDAIAQAVIDAKPETSLAYLLTPTDVYGVPLATAAYAEKRAERAKASALLHKMSMQVMFRPNIRQHVVSGNQTYGLVNSAITQQGPNYTLAKRLQRWRAVVAQHNGTVVSCNVAPASYTRSVTKNRLFSIAYKGASAFGLDAYHATTTEALMAGMLIHDLNNPGSSAYGTQNHPHELFMHGANHCGSWRMPHQLSSMLYPAVIRGVLPW